MSEARRWGSWALAALAVIVIVVGLLPGSEPPISNEARTTALAGNLRCPFCSGESIADAPSRVARDLEIFIAEKVEEGWSDDEVYAFFEARYGEQVRLDPPLGGWGAVLWAAPLALLGVGAVAILQRRRPDSPAGEPVNDTVPMEASR